MLEISIGLRISQATNDDMLGTKEHKKVGDRWAVNSAKVAAEASARGVKIDAEDIRGSTKLEKLIEVDGTKCLKISSKTEMINFRPPSTKSLRVTESNAAVISSGEFPVDVSIRPMSGGKTEYIVLVAKSNPTPDAPEIKVTMIADKSIHVKQRSLKGI